jgi:hypothetical protein
LLRIKSWTHYPAEVVLTSSSETRVSYAVIENLSKLGGWRGISSDRAFSGSNAAK